MAFFVFPLTLADIVVNLASSKAVAFCGVCVCFFCKQPKDRHSLRPCMQTKPSLSWTPYNT